MTNTFHMFSFKEVITCGKFEKVGAKGLLLTSLSVRTGHWTNRNIT